MLWYLLFWIYFVNLHLLDLPATLTFKIYQWHWSDKLTCDLKRFVILFLDLSVAFAFRIYLWRLNFGFTCDLRIFLLAFGHHISDLPGAFTFWIYLWPSNFGFNLWPWPFDYHGDVYIRWCHQPIQGTTDEAEDEVKDSSTFGKSLNLKPYCPYPYIWLPWQFITFTAVY